MAGQPLQCNAPPVNPIRELREAMLSSQQLMALRLGVTRRTLHYVEIGLPVTLPESVKRGLRTLGQDAEELARRYAEWRERRGPDARPDADRA